MSEAERVDVLVAGGGPAGTAAAFRATELGLSTVVLDYDDLMKRIRDYSKEKLILPGFGGGDRMRFPKGGALVDALRFGPIDKDELTARFKELYREHGVGSRIGVELTGLERRPDGELEAIGWSHAERRECRYRAAAVVIAIGRGVPRRFDIPGATEGIAYRLSDPELYVGRPACVIGGGTSAAEAVIAISNAKARAGDPVAVYWSYRGDKMPRVSKALAEVFFEAYVGNGNIRYYPRSEPAAVITAEDRREYLAIRVDRRRLDQRPAETTHLEFDKQCCIACIGEDLPEALLASLGIPMVVGGASGRKRMAVRPFLESRRRNVFLAGDLLCQAYLETDDFDADPRGFREVKHRGNIKSALRDGVLVAEAIRQRLDGHEEIEVRLEDAAEEPSERPRLAVASAPEKTGAPSASRHAAAEACLVRILPSGVEEQEYPLRRRGVTTIGGEGCDLAFPEDSSMSRAHASVSHTEEGYFVRDDGSASGVFVRVPPAQKTEVGEGDLVRAGRQFLVFSIAGGEPAFRHYAPDGAEVGRHALGDKPLVAGRAAPDMVLDAADTTLSRRHLAVAVESGRMLVKDLKSVNGTYLRVRSARRLRHGDQLRLGQQLLAFTLRPEEALEPPPQAAAPPAPSPAAAEPAAGGSTVTFVGAGRACPIAPDQTVCDVAEAQQVGITAECHSGICGSDPVRLVAGRENVAGEADEQEAETLRDLCELEPGEYRLACRLRARGPLEVEILEP